MKNHLQLISATLYVEFTQVQYFDFSDIVQFVKASIIVIRVHLKISTLFMVSHFFSAKVSPEWRLNPALEPRKCHFPLNKGVPSKEVINAKIMWVFLRPLNGGVP